MFWTAKRVFKHRFPLTAGSRFFEYVGLLYASGSGAVRILQNIIISIRPGPRAPCGHLSFSKVEMYVFLERGVLGSLKRSKKTFQTRFFDAFFGGRIWIVFLSVFLRLEASQERPKSAQERPRAPQERPKSGQEQPRASQERPKGGQERPKSAPRAPQERPRAPQEPPKSDPRAAKSGPRTAKSGQQ